jgi:hypothetical protein
MKSWLAAIRYFEREGIDAYRKSEVEHDAFYRDAWYRDASDRGKDYDPDKIARGLGSPSISERLESLGLSG